MSTTQIVHSFGPTDLPLLTSSHQTLYSHPHTSPYTKAHDPEAWTLLSIPAKFQSRGKSLSSITLLISLILVMHGNHESVFPQSSFSTSVS